MECVEWGPAHVEPTYLVVYTTNGEHKNELFVVRNYRNEEDALAEEIERLVNSGCVVMNTSRLKGSRNER